MGCGLYFHDLIFNDQFAELIFYGVSCSAVPPCVDFGVKSNTKYDFSCNIMNHLFMLTWLGLYSKV